MKTTISTISIFLLTSLASTQAFAWGQFGHETVNNAAIDLLDANSPLGRCFRDVRPTIVRYAITPDMEWKTDEFLSNLSPADAAQRRTDNSFEHPLHFFEADAFKKDPPPGQLSNLPAGEYSQVFPTYKNLLRDNAAYVKLVDSAKAFQNPSDPTVADVTIHGTAPWRALELFRKGRDALAAGDTKLALLLLSTMGHYVGDMSQPFHATLDFDGGYYPANEPSGEYHDGIHHQIDTGLFPNPPKDAAHFDIFQNFMSNKTDATGAADFHASADAIAEEIADAHNIMDAVATQAQASYNHYGSHGVGEAQLVSSIMAIVDTGYPLVASLLAAYTSICREATDETHALSKKKGRKIAALPSRPHQPMASTEENWHDPTSGNGGHGSIPLSPAAAAASTEPYCKLLPAGKPGERPQVRELPVKSVMTLNQATLPNGEAVRPALVSRIAASAALLARLWEAAYASAKSPALANCGNGSLDFDQSYAIQKYPTPDYLPAR